METRETTLEPNKPLTIVVTSQGSEFVKLRVLALQAVPMLMRPEQYPEAKREQIASGFRQVLQGNCFDSEDDSDTSEVETETFTDENEGYEPGECLDGLEWEED